MKMISIAAAMALAATPAFAATQVGTSYERSVPAREARAARSDLGSPRAGPEVPELQQGDPADSLYRTARDVLNRGDYGRAARMFNDLQKNYPKSAYQAESQYWEA